MASEYESDRHITGWSWFCGCGGPMMMSELNTLLRIYKYIKELMYKVKILNSNVKLKWQKNNNEEKNKKNIHTLHSTPNQTFINDNMHMKYKAGINKNVKEIPGLLSYLHNNVKQH